MPAVTPKPVRTSKDPNEMFRLDLEKEKETLRNYRNRIWQCGILAEVAMANTVRKILVQLQEH
jgi:bacterioferritin